MARKKNVSQDHLEQVTEIPQDSQPAPAASFAEEESRTAIVGLGASAGGQEAFERFFTHVPPDSGLAFVLVQHLDPTHKSILAELVQRYARMQVFQVEDGMQVAPDCVYVIPPNRDMAVLHGRLVLTEPEAPRGLRLPIDYFFRSLAQDQAEKAIGIVLSGTGTDGTLGLKAIKGEGGLTMAQDPASAEYDGMPRSAIASGLVDYVLPPEQMPRQVLAYVKHPYVRVTEGRPPVLPAAVDWLHKIFVLLRHQTGHDFSLYKQKTVNRRIERRMALHQIQHVEDYYQYLRQTPLEVSLLFRELLIGVTSFFRDPEAFAALQQAVIPRLFEDRQPGDPIRVWVPGCATGEEAYSIAILLRERMDALKREFKVQIFATDVDGEAIEKARAGFYPIGIAADVASERLQRFFVQVDNVYQVGEQIRGMVVFAVQSVVKDPPFSKLDLISCRNLLIYLEPALQRKVVPVFHYALNPGGFLFLGIAESPDEFPYLFTPVDRKWRLFQRSLGDADAGVAPAFPVLPWVGQGAMGRPVVADAHMSIRQATEEMLLEQSPACVVINEKNEILYVHGRTGKYLELPEGEVVSSNLLRMAREGLSIPLAAAIRRVMVENRAVVDEGLPVKTDGETQTIRLTVKPLKGPAFMQGLMVVQFEDMDVPLLVGAASSPMTAAEPIGDHDRRIAQLEHELQAAREYLQSTIEELEASNEELQSTNEEMQSANEELETSREELQSVNEELVTLNSEHETKIEQLVQLNNDMNNVLTQIDIGIIFLDRHLCIRRFNPAATRIRNLIEGDRGRPLSHIASNLAYEGMVQAAQQVLDSLVPKEAEVQARDGHWYWMRIRPYRTTEDFIDGVTLTFTEITEQKRAQAQLRQAEQAAQAARELAESVVNAVREPLLVLDGDLRVVSANQAFHRVFQQRPEETDGRLIYELGNREWDLPRLRTLLEEIIPQDTSFQDLEFEHEFPSIGRKVIKLNAHRIDAAGQRAALILLVIQEASREA